MNQNAIQDDNRFPALIAHSGTAGTATTIRLVGDTGGNLFVNDGNVVPTSGNNPSVVVSKGTTSGTITTTIQKTIGTTVYTKTVVDGGNGTVTISSWV